MNPSTVSPVTFASLTNEQIIGEARRVLAERDPSTLRASHKRLLRSKRPDLITAGKFLWAHLCGWKGGAS